MLPHHCVLLQVCHIVLGLRPVSREEEGDIVKGWLEREERRGYRIGQFWYLIAMDWWKAWTDYVTYRVSEHDSLLNLLLSGISACRIV